MNAVDIDKMQLQAGKFHATLAPIMWLFRSVSLH